MKKTLVLLLALALLCSAANLQIWKAGSSTIEYESNWTLTLKGNPSDVQELVLTINLLSNNSDQQILSLWANREYEHVQNGSDIKLVFHIRNPKQKETVSVKALAAVSYDNKSVPALPWPAEIAVEQIPGTNLTASSPEMSAKAREIVAGAGGSQEGQLEKIALLSEWVHNWVRYDLKYADTSLPAREVFVLREGTCDEYAHLFIAMAKSVGIPSRFVFGYVHSGEEWAPHGWVEAYVPGYGWLPVDPTYNEALNLDASHLRVASGKDQSEITEKVSMSSIGESNEVSIKKDYSLRFVSIWNFTQISEIGISSSQDEMRKETVTVSVKNLRNSYSFVPLKLIPAEGLSLEGDDASSLLLLAPGETKSKSYSVILPELEQNMVYTFPLTVQSAGQDVSSSFQRSTATAESRYNDTVTYVPAAQQPAPKQCALGFVLPLIALFVLSAGKQ